MEKNEKGSGAIIGIIIVILIVIGLAVWTMKYSPAKNRQTTNPKNSSQTQEMPQPQNQPNFSPPSEPSSGIEMPATQTMQITIKNFAFNPNSITIKSGTTVVWTNKDSTAHTVTGDSFSSGQIQPGESFQFAFSTPGTYNYHCSIHPSMTGKIIVQ